MTIPSPGSVATVLGGVSVVTFSLACEYFFQRWFEHNLDRTPRRFKIIFVASLGGALVAAALGIPPANVVVPVLVFGVAGALWGWLRGRSGHRRRWNATYRRAVRLAGSNPDAAARSLIGALARDAAEREQLRAAALGDARAAAGFRGRTKQALDAVPRLEELVVRLRQAAPVDGEKLSELLSAQHGQLAADLEWAERSLPHVPGAA